MWALFLPETVWGQAAEPISTEQVPFDTVENKLAIEARLSLFMDDLTQLYTVERFNISADGKSGISKTLVATLQQRLQHLNQSYNSLDVKWNTYYQAQQLEIAADEELMESVAQIEQLKQTVKDTLDAHAVMVDALEKFVSADELIISKVPVEHIHIMKGQEVDELLDELYRKEMARAVEMHASPREARRIGNNGGRQLEHLKQRLGGGAGKRLTERLDAIEDTRGGASLNGYALTADGKHITLLSRYLRRHSQLDVAHFLLALLGEGEVYAHQIAQIGLQELGLLLQRCRGENLYGSFEGKGFSLLQGYALRQRNNIVLRPCRAKKQITTNK